MRLFPSQSSRVRLVGLVGLCLLVVVPARATQPPEMDLGELRDWAEARAAEARIDQVSLRFAPLVQRLRAQGRVQEALELLQTWLRLSDDANAVAARGAVEILLELERFEELLERISRHRAHAGDRALALEAALAAWELGRFDRAEREFQAALALGGVGQEAALARYQWARFLAWSGRSAESWTMYASLLEQRYGSSADVVLGAARACAAAVAEGACSAQRALDLAQRSVELLPEHTGARYNLVRALEAAGSKEAARAEGDMVRQLMREDQERTQQRGRSRARAAEAATRLQQEGVTAAYRLLCDSAEPEQCVSTRGWRGEDEWLILARVVWAMDRRALAIGLLERLVATHPERAEWRGLLLGWRREMDAASR